MMEKFVTSTFIYDVSAKYRTFPVKFFSTQTRVCLVVTSLGCLTFIVQISTPDGCFHIRRREIL